MLLSPKGGPWGHSVASAFKSGAGFKSIFESVLELRVVEIVGMISP